jgi:hypothetical protein
MLSHGAAKKPIAPDHVAEFRNPFRLHHAKIANSLHHKIPIGELASDLYIPGTTAFTWPREPHEPDPLPSQHSEYEERLIEFVTAEPSTFPILIVRGGVGVGKSTTLSYVISECKTRFGDTEHGFGDRLCVHLDMNTEQDAVLGDPDQGQMGATVWNQLEAQFGALARQFCGEENFSFDFLKWANSYYSHISLFPLRQFLNQNSEAIEKPQETTAATLHSSLSEKMASLDAQDALLYWVLRLSHFIRSSDTYRSLVVFIDNVDHMEPSNQREILGFTDILVNIVPCACIVTIRPHTLSQTQFAAGLKLLLEHEAPDVFAVIESRVTKRCTKDLDPLIVAGLQALIERIKRTEITRNAFSSLCGLSVRFGLRNFYNMTLARNLAWKSQEDIRALNSSTVFQALYCHEEEFLDEELYDNVFSVSGTGEAGRTLIKLRILNYLSQHTSWHDQLKNVIYHLQTFGYSFDLCIRALNELMYKRKLLAWSNGANQYQLDRAPSAMNDSVQLTCIGLGYFRDIIFDPHYLRECVFQINRRRVAPLADWIGELRDDFLREVSRRDVDEIQAAVRKRGRGPYQNYYSSYLSITEMLWTGVGPRLKALAKDVGVVVDEDYGRFVRDRVITLFGEKWR